MRSIVDTVGFVLTVLALDVQLEQALFLCSGRITVSSGKTTRFGDTQYQKTL